MWQEADAKDSSGGEIGRGGLTEVQMNGIVVTVRDTDPPVF